MSRLAELSAKLDGPKIARLGANVFLVVITKPKEKEVYGYRLLDLNKEYGLNEDEHA